MFPACMTEVFPTMAIVRRGFPRAAGQQALLANHGSLWPKQLDQALAKNCVPSPPLSDPDSHFTPFQVEGEAAAAETLILMEFANIGSLDHLAVRARFRRNLVRMPRIRCLTPLPAPSPVGGLLGGGLLSSLLP